MSSISFSEEKHIEYSCQIPSFKKKEGACRHWIIYYPSELCEKIAQTAKKAAHFVLNHLRLSFISNISANPGYAVDRSQSVVQMIAEIIFPGGYNVEKQAQNLIFSVDQSLVVQFIKDTFGMKVERHQGENDCSLFAIYSPEEEKKEKRHFVIYEGFPPSQLLFAAIRAKENGHRAIFLSEDSSKSAEEIKQQNLGHTIDIVRPDLISQQAYISQYTDVEVSQHEEWNMYAPSKTNAVPTQDQTYVLYHCSNDAQHLNIAEKCVQMGHIGIVLKKYDQVMGVKKYLSNLGVAKKNISESEDFERIMTAEKAKKEIEQYNRTQVNILDGENVQASLNGIEIYSGEEAEKSKDHLHILFFNGNTGAYEKHTSEMCWHLEQLKDAGVKQTTAVGFNYRMVNQSTCPNRDPEKLVPAEELIQDGIAQVKRLLDKGVSANNIVLHGTSLGGAIAANVAAYFHKNGQPVNVFCSRTFSTTTNVAVAYTRRIPYAGKALGYLFRPFISFGLWASQWKINTEKAYCSIPEENRDYFTIKSKKRIHKKERSKDDSCLPFYCSLHNSSLLKSKRKEYKRKHGMNNKSYFRKHKVTVVDEIDKKNGKRTCGHALCYNHRRFKMMTRDKDPLTAGEKFHQFVLNRLTPVIPSE